MDVGPEDMAEVDPIPLQPLLRPWRGAERAMFEENIRNKKLKLVTLIKPEIVLYTTIDNPGMVYCLELISNRRPNVNRRGCVLSYRSEVVAILNLSYEHRVRIGVLLSDNTMPIIMIDHDFIWSNKGQIHDATFDSERPHLMVYSRTLNALFWPMPSQDCEGQTDSSDSQEGETKWDIHMCNVNVRRQVTVLRGLPEMELQALKDELVILFRQHGVLFLEYGQLKPLIEAQSGPGPRFYTGRHQQHSNINRWWSAYNDYQAEQDQIASGEQAQLDWGEMASADDSAIELNVSNASDSRPLQGIHWSPDMKGFERIHDLNDFKPKKTEVKLRGHCHSKDQKKPLDRKTNNDEVKRVIALYGNVVYKLTPTICAPLTSIKVPSDLIEPFQLMFLSRIVVVYNRHTIAGYMNSQTPIKVLKGEFLLAGYGIVVKDGGIFRIKMCLPNKREHEEWLDATAYH